MECGLGEVTGWLPRQTCESQPRCSRRLSSDDGWRKKEFVKEDECTEARMVLTQKRHLLLLQGIQ